ncbi:CbtB-domain containing protein [Rhizobiales bacterium]|uniref:CbtB domain-containing protein n=1 Tax=Hongsoonwoonella zoysiae TaxID=2821844 RepID=UPI00155FBEB1|nr:CbtB domain-containing protein [Hongsoonwoonella zoysiae]NRG16238.1 CbtB-domain containing protein [Hongsoonwoonella zoysiae]
MEHSAATVTRPVAITEQLKAVSILTALGMFIVFGVGFAQISAAHNAAHDTRHAIGFPCH